MPFRNKQNELINGMIGKKFGRLIVKERVENSKNRISQFKCICDCGKEKIVLSSNLRQGTTQSCGCLAKERSRERSIIGEGEACFNFLLTSYRNRAKLKGLSFDLTIEEFKILTKKNCTYCGREPFTIKTKVSCNGIYIYNGIDRVDSSKGYIIENCVPCCKICNYAKRKLSLQEFKEHITKIYFHYIKK